MIYRRVLIWDSGREKFFMRNLFHPGESYEECRDAVERAFKVAVG